jgi:hypothetical protein
LASWLGSRGRLRLRATLGALLAALALPIVSTPERPFPVRSNVVGGLSQQGDESTFDFGVHGPSMPRAAPSERGLDFEGRSVRSIVLAPHRGIAVEEVGGTREVAGRLGPRRAMSRVARDGRTRARGRGTAAADEDGQCHHHAEADDAERNFWAPAVIPARPAVRAAGSGASDGPKRTAAPGEDRVRVQMRLGDHVSLGAAGGPHVST